MDRPNMKIRAAVRRLIVCMALIAPTGFVQAETHALLIGVSEVAALPKRLWLRGPDNDVALMRDTLVARGVSLLRIILLASPRIPGSSRPTRRAVADAMQTVLGRVKPGDSVVLLIAGHGTQVPKPAGGDWPEPDRLDEVLLTTDVLAWDATRGELPNALRDDDIGEWIDALVDRGASVWAFFDTCHAAGMARGGAVTRFRGLAAAELGVPAALPPAVPTPPRAVAKSASLPTWPRTDGRVLAFASRGHEGAPEEWLPKGTPRQRIQGVFTFAVSEALRDGASDAAGLSRAVLESYARAGRLSPVPQVIGAGTLRMP